MLNEDLCLLLIIVQMLPIVFLMTKCLVKQLGKSCTFASIL